MTGLPAAAAETGLVLSDAYVRTIIPSRPAGGYFTLANNSDTDSVLTGASSPECGAVMLHKSKESNGVEQMLPVESISVQAHQSISFAPGRYHLMCMSPSPAVKPGASLPMTLKFGDGGSLTGEFAVRGVAGN